MYDIVIRHNYWDYIIKRENDFLKKKLKEIKAENKALKEENNRLKEKLVRHSIKNGVEIKNIGEY